MLDIGIDVSAKYRGAWCEGTIIRRDEQLNCKVRLFTELIATCRRPCIFTLVALSYTIIQVTFTDKTLGSTMSKHTDIDGNIAVSSSVYARHGTTHKMHKATIQKITDGTLYTVRFHDGDERTLRRNAVTLMGPQVCTDIFHKLWSAISDPFVTLLLLSAKTMRSMASSFRYNCTHEWNFLTMYRNDGLFFSDVWATWLHCVRTENRFRGCWIFLHFFGTTRRTKFRNPTISQDIIGCRNAIYFARYHKQMTWRLKNFSLPKVLMSITPCCSLYV